MKEVSNTIRCILVDDEPLQLEVLTDYVEKVPALQLVGAYTNAFDAIRIVQEQKIDLVFLDIQMPELTGVQVMEILQHKTRFILTTAYTEYALKSYDYEVIDYLVKPISFERFYKGVEKACAFLNTKAASSPGTAELPVTEPYLFVKSGTKIIKVNIDDILYIEGLKDYVLIKTIDGQIITLETLSSLEKKLSNRTFIRIHKSYIVALPKISYIEKNSVTIRKTTIPIGNTYKEAFLKNIHSSRLDSTT